MAESADPHARNNDEDRRGLTADGYHIGDSDGDIAIAFTIDRLPCDIGVFLDREQALEFLGRLSFEIKEKGWLS